MKRLGGIVYPNIKFVKLFFTIYSIILKLRWQMPRFAKINLVGFLIIVYLVLVVPKSLLLKLSLNNIYL